MRAIVITRPGGPEVLALHEATTPEPAAGEIRVRVLATALNRADVMQRRGNYPAPAGAPADIPGLEYAGSVVALGDGVTRWQPGARVMGLVGGGSYAEYVVVHQDEAMPMPPGMTFEHAAAIPEAFLTAHDGLRQLELAAGQTLVVHGVASGVGTAAVQLAARAGARVIGTSRSEWKLARMRELGLGGGAGDDSDDSGGAGGAGGAGDGRGGGGGGAGSGRAGSIALLEAAGWVDGVKRLTDGRGADAILDLVGGDYLRGDLEAIAGRGRILIVGLVAGARAELDMRMLLNKRARIGGTVMRARTLDEKIAVARAFEADALGGFSDGTLKPIVETVLPLEQAAEAHRMMEANANVGKVVLRVG